MQSIAQPPIDQGTDAHAKVLPFRVNQHDSPEQSHDPERPWPVMDEAAFYGLAGDVVRAIAPHTEGDPVAILTNFLTMFGSAVGRGPHAAVGATRHGTNLFMLHVGNTSRARKGTAYDESLRVVSSADATWPSRIVGGLSSGEGVIYAVRDATWKTDKTGAFTINDDGVEDKRLQVTESEFSSVLKMASRDGNTLTEVLRRAWDSHDLQILTKNSPCRATAPHVSLLGHITEHELRRTLSDTAQLNGFANRFQIMCVRRSRLLPHGGTVPDATMQALTERVGNALAAARERDLMRRDGDANRAWEAVYPALTADRPGMLGAIMARAEAHVLRLSLLYALLDNAAYIQVPHLYAASAVWKYAEASAMYLFGDATGDPIADRVHAALRRNGPMSQNDLRDLFGQHVKAAVLSRALETLVTAGKIVSRQVVTGGRPCTVWGVKS
jgi:hypothetical protein